MRTLIVALALAALGAPAVPAAESLKAGDRVENFSLRSVDGRTHALGQYADSTAVVVMFIATQCPVSNEYNARMVELTNAYRPRGIAFLGVNSNRQESVQETAAHARQHGFPFPVLKDENNVIADRFGATRTPEIYVLSPGRIVLYHGRIDDSQTLARVESRDLADALDAILAGRPVTKTETRAFGCTIKRVAQAQ